jgi:Ca2+/Na+ antiporter
MAKSSRMSTAMSAVYAGPLLDVLVAIPLGFAYLIGRAHTRSVPAELPTSVLLGGCMLIFHCLATLVTAYCNHGRLPSWFWKWCVALYGSYMLALVAMHGF